jgi:hypothetical protein
VKDDGGMEYQLTRLGPTQFSYLVRDILHESFGINATLPEARGFKQVDTLFKGRIAWPASATQEIWQGVTLIRTIFYSPNAGPAYNSDLMLRSIEKQLNDIKNHSSEGRKHPNNLFFITNVDLEMDSTFHSRLGIVVKNYDQRSKAIVWDYSDLCPIIDQNPSIRKIYAGFMAPGDAIADLSRYINYNDHSFGGLISRQLAMDLIADQWVHLNQAGRANHERLSLSNVAVDLPIEGELDAKDGKEAAAFALTLGDQILRPSRIGTKARPHLVIVGGPGQGKTTMGQLICQVHRSAMLSGSQGHSSEVVSIVGAVRQSLSRIGLRPPACRRWPIRVELAAFADEASNHGGVGLLRYIADQISNRVPDKVDISLIRNWMRSWPWLVVLDGLDEVPSQSARELLMLRISEFLEEVAQTDCDLFLIATTRPQGYTGEFSENSYRHITLTPLTTSRAAHYAERLAEVQHASDPDLMQKIIGRMQRAAQEESTARLMRSPLQVTIMSLLLETRERAPQARYALFEAYYETIYAREAAKPGLTGRLLNRMRSHINALHDRVGFALQIQAENKGEADASMSRDELRDLAVERLKAEGYPDEEASGKADEVVLAVIQRLVLIIPKAIDDIGFEVRSIQEFMAARALVSGSDTVVLQRLSLLVGSAHWRNTWLFAAGRIFTEREHLRRDLISLLEDKDVEDIVMKLVAPGADLALDLLDDDLAIDTPLQQRALAHHALTLLRCPPDNDLERRAGVLYRYANEDQVIREDVYQAIEHAVNGNFVEKLAAEKLFRVWRSEVGALGARARQLTSILQSNGFPSADSVDSYKTQLPESVSIVLNDSDLATRNHSSMKTFVRNVAALKFDLEQVYFISGPDDRLTKILDEYLSDEVTSTAIVDVTRALARERTDLSVKLRVLFRIRLQRRPCGELLSVLTPYP